MGQHEPEWWVSITGIVKQEYFNAFNLVESVEAQEKLLTEYFTEVVQMAKEHL